MKIAFLAIKGMPLGGGIEKYTEEIGSRLVSRGHKVTVYTMRRYGAIDGSYKGMHIKTLPSVNVRSLEKMSAVLFGSIDCVINSDVDIAHYHAIGPSIFSFMPRFKGVKVISWNRMAAV